MKLSDKIEELACESMRIVFSRASVFFYSYVDHVTHTNIAGGTEAIDTPIRTKRYLFLGTQDVVNGG